MSENAPRRPSPLPVYIALFFLLVFATVFMIEFAQLSRDSGGVQESELTSDTYMDTVNILLETADAENGALAILQYGCTTCHAGSNAGRLAPDFAMLSGVMSERRPPLTGTAYVYESIVYPGAYTVEGYVNNMPRIYEEQIPEQELGDIIAYLISQQPANSE